jgi:hypothetical protein
MTKRPGIYPGAFIKNTLAGLCWQDELWARPIFGDDDVLVQAEQDLHGLHQQVIHRLIADVVDLGVVCHAEVRDLGIGFVNQALNELVDVFDRLAFNDGQQSATIHDIEISQPIQRHSSVHGDSFLFGMCS